VFCGSRFGKFTSHHQNFFGMLRGDLRAGPRPPAKTRELGDGIPRLADAKTVEMAGL
jgi:hypothetical protein